jgi:predicted aconitase
LKLTQEEKRMRSGALGEPVRRAIEHQMRVGEFWGAERMVPVTNVHMMADIEVMGEAGLGFLRETLGLQARARCPTTTNARCMDFAWAERWPHSPGAVAKEREVIALLQRMDVTTVDTCINYQTVYQPHFGEHVAWGDTGTVIYANSVFGARSNFEAGPSALAASLTGRTPAYGFHLDEHRRGTISIELGVEPKDVADWGAIGKLVGEPNQDYFAVPVFTGVKRTPTSDELKHLGASLASYGSMAMFHMEGVTPEAATLGKRRSTPRSTSNAARRIRITSKDLNRVYAGYQYGEGATIVVFSGPQLSLWELKNLAALFGGRKVHSSIRCFASTNRQVLEQARALGVVKALEAAGVGLLEGMCFYILERLSGIREENRWVNLVSNSAKIVNTITAHRFRTILRPTAACVDIACSGKYA